jgi:DNA mismatch endonuclease, patch repair protein
MSPGMLDPLSPAERSERMSRVRSRGNRSTEGRVREELVDQGIKGWVSHPDSVPGRPDFYFEERRLAVFVDGCFWHGCPNCGRLPKTRVEFWRAKIGGNRRRDRLSNRRLWREGYRVLRIRECDLKRGKWVRRLTAKLASLSGQGGTPG